MELETKSNGPNNVFGSDLLASRKIRLLILDDNDIDRLHLEKTLIATSLIMQVDHASTICELKDALQQAAYDIILADFHLPDGTGLEAIDIIKQSRENAAASIIMVSGDNQTDIAVTAIKSGSADYVIKDEINPAVLQRAILLGLQQPDLHRKVKQLGDVFKQLQTASRVFAERSANDVRPLIENALLHIKSIRYLRSCDAEKIPDHRIRAMETACAEMLSFCDEVEQSYSKTQ